MTPEGILGVTIRNATTASKLAIALERAEASAKLVAVTVTVLTDVPLGAVHNPVLVIVPALANQFTAVLLVFRTRAENCTFPPAANEVEAGEIWTATGLLAGLPPKVVGFAEVMLRL
jgi:hypothetical protein